MTKRSAILFLLFVATGTAIGCAHGDWEKYRNDPPSQVDAHWGEAYHQVKAEQVANPDAGLDTAPPEGMPAREADTVVDYHAERSTADYQNSDRGSIVRDLEN